MKNGKTLNVQSLWRAFDDGEIEDLEFQPGINVIVGAPNTGKTKWLRTLDYLFGDPDTPERTLGADITQKYRSAGANLLIGENTFEIERRWKETGKRTKIFVNGAELAATELSNFILEELEIPIIEFPRGNPADENNWVTLSWRSLLRHIYRREKFWSDIANEQPPFEQHACIAQFLGLAEHIFRSQSNKKLSLLQKEKDQLVLKKDQYMEILREISGEIVSSPEFSGYPTKSSISAAITAIQSEIEQQINERERYLRSLQSQSISETEPNVLKDLSERWSQLYTLRDAKEKERISLSNRYSELEKYQRTLFQELDRMSRARIAGIVLSDFKVTQCPVCDQDVQANVNPDSEDCYLCHRRYPHERQEVKLRIDFEIQQLKEQNNELDALIQRLKRAENELSNEVQKLHREVSRIEVSLRSVRTVAAAILPPEIGIIDQNIGSLREKISQLESLNGALDRRDAVVKQIDELEAEIQKIRAEVTLDKSAANFEQAAELLEEGMNVYLKALATAEMSDRWNQGHVKVKLDDRTFSFTIGDSFWDSKLGFTYMADFLMSYHYALLRLSNRLNCNYPGLTILDFPLNSPRENFVGKETYLIEPFQKIIQGMKDAKPQVIATGRTFHGLDNVTKIELTKVYQAADPSYFAI